MLFIGAFFILFLLIAGLFLVFLEEISQRTCIKEIRLSEAYYRNGALDAHEILLIEKVIGLEAGYLFKLIFEKKG